MALNLNGTTGISGIDGSSSTPVLKGTDTDSGISFGSDIVTFNVGGSEKARLHSNGNFGIGRTDPDQKLVVRGSGTTILKVENSDDGTAQLTLGNTGSVNLGIQQVGGETVFQEGGVERMRIDDQGRLCIGTDSPDTTLDIEATGDCTLTITAGSTSHDSKIEFAHGTTVDGGIQFNHDGSFGSEYIDFRVGNNTNHMRIHGGGAISIGDAKNVFDANAT